MTNGQTVWEPPIEVVSGPNVPPPSTAPRSRNISSDVVASWREMTAANGKKYYYNAATKMSMWEMPSEYAEHLEKMKDPTRVDKEVLEAKFMTMLKEMVAKSSPNTRYLIF